MNDWWLYRGTGQPHDAIERLPAPPPWRQFTDAARVERGAGFRATAYEIEMVNTALLLRRPLLVTGKPGTGKSSLAFAVAHELDLGPVLVWPITSRSTLRDGLYRYDAIARVEDASLARATSEAHESASRPAMPSLEIGNYIRLGPLGAAMLGTAHENPRPRVLLIDEIDKSDIDLPNDLLNIFEDGELEIPELSRLPNREELRTISVALHGEDRTVPITRGKVQCTVFPFVILTSNAEREFPPAFLRRCLRLEIPAPTKEELAEIVRIRLAAVGDLTPKARRLIDDFVRRRDVEMQDVATDQLLNAIYLVMRGIDPQARDAAALKRDLRRVRPGAAADVGRGSGKLIDDLLKPLTESATA